MTQEYLVIDCDFKGPSQRTEGQYWCVKLLGVEDGCYYTTYPDTTMRNFPQWTKIVDSELYHVVTGLKVKRQTTIVNADGEPHSLHQLTRSQMRELETAILASKSKTVSTYPSLFE